jgi:hypothetical protein
MGIDGCHGRHLEAIGSRSIGRVRQRHVAPDVQQYPPIDRQQTPHFQIRLPFIEPGLVNLHQQMLPFLGGLFRRFLEI